MAASSSETLTNIQGSKQIADTIGLLTPRQLLERDSEGKTLMHHAIAQTNPVAIEALSNKNYQTLKQPSKNGFLSEISPLAFAMKCYNDTPSIEALSIVNQIYFSLDRDWGDRCKALDQRADVVGGHIFYASRVWEHGLSLCFIRNNSNKITGINMDWIDIVVKAVKDGLTVMGGMRVDEGLLIEYAGRTYGSTAQGLIFEAIDKRAEGLAARTIAQTQVNNTLYSKAEFMRQAVSNLPTLCKIDSARSLDNKAIKPNSLIQQVSSTGDVNYYFKDKEGKQINLNTSVFSEAQASNLDKVNKIFDSMTENKSRTANLDEASCIMNILPAKPKPESSNARKASSRRTLRTERQRFFIGAERDEIDDKELKVTSPLNSSK